MSSAASGDRHPSLELETRALAESPEPDSLRANILRLVALGAYAELFGEGGICHEDALIGFAAATSKAVALALQAGPDACVSADSFGDVAFNGDDAVRVLLGMSALLENGPKLLSSVRHATVKAETANDAASEAAE